MKLIFILTLASLPTFAGEIKVMDIGQKDLFTYDRIDPELIIDHKSLRAGVNVKLSSGFLSEYLPRDNSVLLNSLSFNKETGEILLNYDNKTILCGLLKKKENGSFYKNVRMTGACRFDQRYEEQLTRVSDILTRVQVLEIYLTF